jgi:hypothetical protein
LKTQQRLRRDLGDPFLGAGEANKPVRPRFEADFEHKLKVKRSPEILCRQSFFTESLILAQDERWRRA